MASVQVLLRPPPFCRQNVTYSLALCGGKAEHLYHLAQTWSNLRLFSGQTFELREVFFDIGRGLEVGTHLTRIKELIGRAEGRAKNHVVIVPKTCSSKTHKRSHAAPPKGHRMQLASA